MPRTVFTPVDLNLSQAVLAQAILDDLAARHTLGCNQASPGWSGRAPGVCLLREAFADFTPRTETGKATSFANTCHEYRRIKIVRNDGAGRRNERRNAMKTAGDACARTARFHSVRPGLSRI